MLTPLGEVVDQAIDYLKTNEQDGLTVPTGLLDLNRALRGGLRRGVVTVLAGRPCLGKSIFAWQLAEHVARTQGAVLYFSPSMSGYDLALSRLDTLCLTNHGGLLATLTAAMSGIGVAEALDREKLVSFRALPLLVDDDPTLSHDTLSERVLEYRRGPTGEAVRLVVLDDLENICAYDVGDDEYVTARQAMEALAKIARDLDIPVFVTTGVTRRAEDRPHPSPVLADVWGGGAVEQVAKLVMGLYREEYYHPGTADKGTAKMEILKNAFGPAHVTCTVNFDAEGRAFADFC